MYIMSLTFCRRHLQSRDMTRLAKREKARFWMMLLSGASAEASFMTECISELVEELLDPGTRPGPLPQRELHAGNRKRKIALLICSYSFIFIRTLK